MTDYIAQANELPMAAGAVWLAFDPVDLDLIEWEGDTHARARVLDNSQLGPSGTLFVGDQCLCAIGVADRRGGVGEAWAVIDARLRHKYPKLLTKATKQAVDIAAQSLGLSIVNLYVQSAQINAMRWAKALGFRLEGELVFYDHPKQNHFIFARRF